MRGGHNRKSRDLKILEGTSKTADTSRKPKPVFPKKAPRGFPKHARKLWSDYAPLLADLGVLRETDRPGWEVLCLTYQTIKECEDQLREEGLTVDGAKGGKVKHPCISILNAARQQFRLMSQQFGLDPASRERLGVYVEEADDEMERLLFKSMYPDV